jgi:hypothetical protein
MFIIDESISCCGHDVFTIPSKNEHVHFCVGCIVEEDMHKKVLSCTVELEQMDPLETAEDKSIFSQMGKRRAYQDLVDNQSTCRGEECKITFFQMLSYYRLSKYVQKGDEDDNMELQEGNIIPINAEDGS